MDEYFADKLTEIQDTEDTLPTYWKIMRSFMMLAIK